MKSLSLILLIGFILNIATIAQTISDYQVPTVVAASFKSKFPQAWKISWKIKSEDEYEANFHLNPQNQEEASASFDTAGTWLKTATRINTSAVPHNVLTAMWKEFPKVGVNEATKIESSHDGISYYMEISNRIEMYQVLFSEDGKMLSHTKIR